MTVKSYLVSYVDLGEAESLQMNARSANGRSNGFYQQLLQILTDKGPSLLYDLHDNMFHLLFFLSRSEYSSGKMQLLSPKSYTAPINV